MHPRIFYIAAIRLPTEKAHGLQIMKMCEALAEEGVAVELVIPGRETPIKGDAFEYYAVEKRFSIVHCRVLDLVRFGRAGFLLTTILFGLLILKMVFQV
jgi:hypothetical protein